MACNTTVIQVNGFLAIKPVLIHNLLHKDMPVPSKEHGNFYLIQMKGYKIKTDLTNQVVLVSLQITCFLCLGWLIESCLMDFPFFVFPFGVSILLSILVIAIGNTFRVFL